MESGKRLRLPRIRGVMSLLLLLGSIPICRGGAEGLRPTAGGPRVAYYGENFMHPGSLMGYELEFSDGGWHALVAGISAANATFAPFSTSFLLAGNAGYRLTFPFGLNLEAELAAGYKHKFLLARTFSYTNGVVAERLNLGQPLAFLLLDAGLGFDLRMLGGLPVNMFLRLGVSAEGPMNTVLLFHPVIIAGTTWYLTKEPKK